MLSPFKNTKGSTIKRGGSLMGHKYSIGKVIGGKVYLHINYIDTLPDPEEAIRALEATNNVSRYRCLSYDPKTSTYMFSASPYFNSANEPTPGQAQKVEVEDNAFKVHTPKVINSIWHHKWMWVDDNYKGFNVKESYEWSKEWAAEISNPSGSKNVWLKQLKAVGLVTEGFNHMKNIVLNDLKEDEAVAEINDMEKLVEAESIHEDEEEKEEYSSKFIASFTFEDGMLPKRDGTVGTREQFEAAFGKNGKVFTVMNIHGYSVLIATERDDLYNLGFIIMNTKDFIAENPDGLYDDWVGLLNEVSV